MVDGDLPRSCHEERHTSNDVEEHISPDNLIRLCKSRQYSNRKERPLGMQIILSYRAGRVASEKPILSFWKNWVLRSGQDHSFSGHTTSSHETPSKRSNSLSPKDHNTPSLPCRLLQLNVRSTSRPRSTETSSFPSYFMIPNL